MSKTSLEWTKEELPRVADDFKESIVHGDLLLSMSVHKSNIKENIKQVLYMHWHEELELLYLTKGKAKFQINGLEYDVKAGDLLLVRPGDLHFAQTIDYKEVEFFAVLVHYNFLSSCMNDTIQQQYIRPFYYNPNRCRDSVCFYNGKNEKIIEELKEIAVLYLEESPGFELLIKAKLFQVLYYLYLNQKDNFTDFKVGEGYQRDVMHIIMTYIQNNYNKLIKVEEAAKEVNMSVGYFSRFFKKHMNMTFIEYLNSFRITQAAKLIETSDKTLTEIALDTGFKSINYFIITFKKIVHMTPKEYRNNLKKR